MVQHLTSEQLDDLRDALSNNNYISYYNLLHSYGENYAALALDVASSQSLSGRVARAFASARGQELGVSISSQMWAQISLDLAQADFNAREILALGLDDRNNEISSIDLRVDIVRNYHADVFERYGLNISAWTAYVPLELAGDLQQQQEKWELLKQPGLWNEITQGSWTAVSTILDDAFVSDLAPTIVGLLGNGWAGAIALNILDASTDDQPADVWIRNIFLASGAIFGLNDFGTISAFSIDQPGGGKIIGGNGEPAIEWSDWLNGFGQNADDDDGASSLIGTDFNDVILGYSGDDRLVGGGGNDALHGGSGNDTLIGSAGNDLIDGGEGDDGGLLFIPGWDPNDTADYSDSPSGVTLVLGSQPLGQDISAFEVTNDGYGGKDIILNIEKVVLTGQSDRVNLIGDLDGLNGSWLSTAFTVEMGASPVAIDQDQIDTSSVTTGIYLDLGSGKAVGLDQTSDREYFNWLGSRLGTVFEPADLQITGANSVIGTAYSDLLFASTGSRDSGEGYSTLYGGAGNDWLVGAGWESHLYGGSGKDQFSVGSNTFIEDADESDTVLLYGIRLFGGVKQWWMEGDSAYWSPFSSVMNAFPVIGNSLLTTASFFVDAVTMLFASYERNASGDLEIRSAWGLGGTTYIKDYSLDLDSGVGTGGITVFQQELAENLSFENHKKYVNLSLKAGFGIGLGGVDPLVLDLDGDGLELTTLDNSNAYFEFDGDGFGERTGWVRGDDGLLALDSNANGKIDGISELFGDQTAAGFSELATLDSNDDGTINASDAAFGDLRVWQDSDQDGVTDAGELKTLGDLGITSINLANAAPTEVTTIAGNTIARAGTFIRNGQARAIADVTFNIDQMRTRWLGDSTVSSAAGVLPDVSGRGELKDLRVAMTGDSALLALVSDFTANATADLAELKVDAEEILYAWAGVAAVPTSALGSGGFDERKLAFLERQAGLQLMPRDGNGGIQLTNLPEMQNLWDDQVMRLTLRLVVQGPLSETFDSISYNKDYDLLVADTPTALVDVYAALLDDLPSDPEDALAQWEEWAPLLGAMADGMVRHDNNVVRDDFIAAQLLAAMDGISQPLDFAALANALGIDDLRIGTSGNDSLFRGPADGAAIYLSNGGTDVLNGGTGQDVYIFGEMIGNVVINDTEAKPNGDRIRFAFLSADEVSLARDGDDLLITVTMTGETVRVVAQFADVVPISSDVLLSANHGVEEIQFADGQIFEIPDIMIAVGKGTSGNDHLVGTMHSDALQGGLGNDLLEGGDNADLYVVNAGEGQDIIRDIQTTPLLRAADMLIFGDDIAPDDLKFSRAGASGNDLLITIGSEGQSVLIEGQFAYSSLGYNSKWNLNSRIEAFGFREYGDGWSNQDLQQNLITASTTNGADITRGFGDNDTFGASAGNDTLIGMDGQDTYHWGVGAGNDTIDEQALYIDISVGLGGLTLGVPADTVLFDESIAREDIVFSRPSSAPNLLITNTATGETLTIKDQFAGFQTGVLGAQWFDRVEWFKFADGTSLSWKDVALITTTGDSGNDQLFGDVLVDRLEGKAGDDLLSGLGGGDTYVFNLGDGHDTISDNDTSFLGDGFLTMDPTPDVLVLGEGILASEVTFERNGKSVTMVLGAGGDRVTLDQQDQYIYTGVFGTLSSYRIEEIRFHDGTVWTWHDLNQRMIEFATTTGDDLTLGTSTDDVFAASTGNDILDGADGNDTYAFGRGSGHDIIRDRVDNIFAGENDKVVFATGIVAEDLAFSKDGDALIVTIIDTGDTLRIERQFEYYIGAVWNDVDLFEFADGTTLTNADIQQILLTGGAGDDSLVGFGTDDVIDGGSGNDIMSGKDGSDTYVFGRGYGQDIIRESVAFVALGDNDRVLFKAGVVSSDIAFSRSGNDLIVSIVGTSDTLKIEGEFTDSSGFTWNDVETFEFADGTIITKEDVRLLVLAGTPGNDHLIGFDGNDVLDGGAGDDILEGRDGNDTYRFGVGDGNDVLVEQLVYWLQEYDTLELKAGVAPADVTVTRVGQDAILSLASGDTIRIQGQFDEGYNEILSSHDIELVKFADGTTWDKVEIDRRSIHATVGNDVMLGSWYSQTYDGLGGDDTIYGGGGTDQITGGTGNDQLLGGSGNDTYSYAIGDGDDVIYDYDFWGNGNNTLKFGAGIGPADLVISGTSTSASEMRITFANAAGSILVTNQWGNDSAIDRFEFADGSSWSISAIAAAFSAGQSTPGDDVINGTNEANVLAGGAGNDQLFGGAGDDTYLFNRGDGADTIFDRGPDGLLLDGYQDGGIDRLVFGPDIAPADIIVTQLSSRDVRLSITGTSDSLLLRDVVSHGAAAIDRIEFADGTFWTIGDVVTKAIAPTPGDDVHYAGYMPNTLEGGAGNDTLYGSSGADILAGGAGTDLLYGGEGDDTYRFNRGDGTDTIHDRGRDGLFLDGYQGGGTDRIVMGPDIAPSDIAVTQLGARDVRLSINGTTDTLTLKDLLSHEAAGLESVEFADGTVWTLADVILKSQVGTAGNDTIYAGYTASTLAGGAGDDTIYGSVGADDISGGAGADTLYGSSGNDIYRFGIGDGAGIVYDLGAPDIYGNSGNGGVDRIEIGAGVNPADIDVLQGSANDIVLQIRGTSDRLTLSGQISDGRRAIEFVHFTDGTTWSFADILAKSQVGTAGDDTIYSGNTASILVGAAGNDTLYGSTESDDLSGGAGNDALHGSSGNDTYRFGLGDGADLVYDIGPENIYGYFGDGGTDRIEISAGVNPADIDVLQSSSSDIVLQIKGTSDRLTLGGQINDTRRQIEIVHFADGTTWDYSQILAKSQVGTSGNDTIYSGNTASTLLGGGGNDILYGSGGDDDLAGGTGNDTLNGSSGNDTYRFGLGDGSDVVYDIGPENIYGNFGDGGTDRIEIGAGVAPADIDVLQVSSSDIVLQIRGTNDRLTLSGQITDTRRQIEIVHFADGTTWNYTQILAKSQVGTSGNDTIYSGNTASILQGGGGNDTLYGSGGDDDLSGGTGNDTLRGSSGNDTYRFGLGDGADVIYDVGPENLYGNLTDGGTDRIEIGAGVAPADIDVFRTSAGDVILQIRGSNDLLTLTGQIADTRRQIETVHFADGTSWSAADLQTMSGTGPAWFFGGAGNDSLSGSGQDEVFAGQGGDDYLAGYGGGDIYRYASGDGNDTIFDDDQNPNAIDRLVLTDLDPGDVELNRSGSDIWVRDIATNQSVRINYQFHSSGAMGLERIVFADGTEWDRVQIQSASWFRGGSGNDSLAGTNDGNTFVGNGGDDYLAGYGGGDSYRYASGDGNDTVFDDDQNANAIDRLILTDLTPADVELYRSGSDIFVRDIATNQSIKISYQYHSSGAMGVERIAFADGTEWNREQINSAVWYRGGSGYDEFYGTTASETFVGGLGDDYINGSGGSDTYRYASGDGNDRIVDGFAEVAVDTLKLIDLNPSQIALSRSGNDLYVRDVQTNQSIRVERHFDNAHWGIERIDFADGTVWERAQIDTVALGTTGTDNAETLIGTSGNDAIYARRGNDTLVGGPGNDTLYGAAGSDTYRFNLGDGQDVISEYDGQSYDQSIDKIEFGAGITPSNVSVTQLGGNDIVLSINGTTDKITILNSLSYADWRVDQVTFQDGTVWNNSDIVTRSTLVNSGNDTFYGNETDNLLGGGSGNDALYGRRGNDTLAGGTGNDTLYGAAGADTYRFNLGDGQDVIAEYDGQSYDQSVDKIELGAGIAPTDVIVSQANNGNDFVLSINGTTDKITIQNSLSYADWRIDQVTFENGTVWSHTDLLGRSMLATSGNDTFFGDEAGNTVEGGNGNDSLYGRRGNDILVGGAGNDTLYGAAGADTYRFNLGDGQDQIVEYDGQSYDQALDKIEFGIGIAPGDVSVTKVNNGNDFLLSIAGTSDSITIRNTVSYADWRIDQVVFQDGTVWSHGDMVLM